VETPWQQRGQVKKIDVDGIPLSLPCGKKEGKCDCQGEIKKECNAIFDGVGMGLLGRRAKDDCG